MRKNATRIIAFVLVVLCFVLWGVANQITISLTPFFPRIFLHRPTDAYFIQFAFYIGYFLLAVPAAILTWSSSYKNGMLIGLALCSLGAFLFYPAAYGGQYFYFCISFFVIAAGLSFLETSANPYIFTIGSKQRAFFRINLAQSFNSVGWLASLYVAHELIINNVFALSADQRMHLDSVYYSEMAESDIQLFSSYYIWGGVIVAIVGIAMALIRIPEEYDQKLVYYYDEDEEKKGITTFTSVVSSLLANRRYCLGILTQFVYVGLQTIAWLYIIDYVENLLVAAEYSETQAQTTAQQMLLVSFALFTIFRFVNTFLMRRLVRPAILMTVSAAIGIAVTMFTQVLGDIWTMWVVVCVGGCLSLMYPTIYALSLKDLDIDTIKVASAGHVMVIIVGAVIPFLLQKYQLELYGVFIMLSFACILSYSLWTIHDDNKWLSKRKIYD